MAEMRVKDRADFERIRDLIWQEDPLGVAEDRQLVPDEYDDLAWKMMHALRQLAGDSEINAEWDRQLSLLSGEAGSDRASGPFLEALHATKLPSSFAARLRAATGV